MATLISSILFLCVIFEFGFGEEVSNSEPALLIVSFDAFRPDYMNRNITPNLNKFRAEGTSAQYMNPVFPTKTFVNHFTMVTGLYPENHGILGNVLYDSKLGKIGYGYDLFHYNESTTPIWISNQMAGKYSGCMWPGSEFDYRGMSCTFKREYKIGEDFEPRVDAAMSWFNHKETPANLVMLYIDQPDGFSHVYGPDSEQVLSQVKRADRITTYIQQKLIENKLENRVNVFHLSDHGMIGVAEPNFINLKDFVANNSCEFFGSSPVLQVVPNDSANENVIFANLSKAAKENGHFKVYNKDNIPARWRANNPRRTGPIIAVADSGYAFQDQFDLAIRFENEFNHKANSKNKYGVHGGDNADPEMRAMFMAKGPLLSKGKRLKPVNVIDLYNLFCSILKIECEKNDGNTDLAIWHKLFSKNNNNEKLIERLRNKQKQ